MKKIVVISCVKNESDIIESFCRYNLLFCDAILIHENNKSSDNTREIIQCLIDEGLPIFFEYEKDIYYEEAKRKLTEAAIEKYGADLVIPMDTDEFLCRTEGGNPREMLEAMKEDVEYQAIWRTYIYEKEPDIKLGFMPNNFALYRNPKMEDPAKYERHKKAFASRYLIEDKRAFLTYGAHFLVYPDSHKGDSRTEVVNNLVFAHFPIRSKAQVLRKTIVNWINKWQAPERMDRDILDAFHLGVLFNEIKQSGDVTAEELKQFSINYAMLLDASTKDELRLTGKDELEKLKRDLGDTLEVAGRLDTSFGGDKLVLRYTDYKDEFKALIRATLEITDSAVTYLASESDGKTTTINELVRQKNELGRQIDELNLSISEIYNSKTWKLGNKLNKVFRIFVPHRRNK